MARTVTAGTELGRDVQQEAIAAVVRSLTGRLVGKTVNRAPRAVKDVEEGSVITAVDWRVGEFFVQLHHPRRGEYWTRLRSVVVTGLSAEAPELNDQALLQLQCTGTTSGVRALLETVTVMLPRVAPAPPPRKGSAWIEGYEHAAAMARDILSEVRRGLLVVEPR